MAGTASYQELDLRHIEASMGHHCSALLSLALPAATLRLGSGTDMVMVHCRTWQAVERLLNTDAVLLGRRLITCGAHAAAEELCARRRMPADYVVEVIAPMPLPLAMQQPAQVATIFTICSCAL